jgi:hypothetical protein
MSAPTASLDKDKVSYYFMLLVSIYFHEIIPVYFIVRRFSCASCPFKTFLSNKCNLDRVCYVEPKGGELGIRNIF